MVGKCFKGLTDELLTWQTKQLLARETGRRGIAVLVRPELVVEIALDGVQSSTRYAGGVALRFARVKRYRPDKNAGEADMIDDLRALLLARAADEFQASGPSKEVPNRKDENPRRSDEQADRLDGDDRRRRHDRGGVVRARRRPHGGVAAAVRGRHSAAVRAQELRGARRLLDGGGRRVGGPAQPDAEVRRFAHAAGAADLERDAAERRARGRGGEAEGGARRRPDHERLRRADAESPRGRPRRRVLVLAAPGRVGQGRAAVLGRGEAPADAARDGNVRLGCGAASLRAATSVRRDLSGWRRRTLAREIPGARLLVLERAATAIPDAVAGEVAAAMLALQAHTVPAPTAGGRHRRAVRPLSGKGRA